MTIPAPNWQTADRQAAPRHQLAAITDTLTDELASRLLPSVRRAEIRTQISTALTDLRGSVSSDSLAEMATRLAEYRLTTRGCA